MRTLHVSKTIRYGHRDHQLHWSDTVSHNAPDTTVHLQCDECTDTAPHINVLYINMNNNVNELKSSTL